MEKLIEIYRKLENAGLMVTAGKKSAAELMVSHNVVPIVRCYECKKEGTEDCPMVHRDKFFGNLWSEASGMDFCSRGDKKDGDDA